MTVNAGVPGAYVNAIVPEPVLILPPSVATALLLLNVWLAPSVKVDPGPGPSKVAPAATMIFELLATTPAPISASVPWLIVVLPVKVSYAARATVPGPLTVKPPFPLHTLLNVIVRPVSGANVT